MKNLENLVGRKFKNVRRGYTVKIVEVQGKTLIGYEVNRLAVDTKVHRIGLKVLEIMEEVK